MEKVIRIRKTGEADHEDRNYWLKQTPLERLKALEEICNEYNAWRYTDAEQRLQRVVRIIKRA